MNVKNLHKEILSFYNFTLNSQNKFHFKFTILTVYFLSGKSYLNLTTQIYTEIVTKKQQQRNRNKLESNNQKKKKL